MKLTILRETLLKPLQAVSGVVERRQTLPILANILLRAENKQLTLTGTDLEVELIAKATLDSDDTGECTLPARKFMDICRSLPDETEIKLNLSGDRATLQAGKSRFTLATLPIEDFPVIEEIAASWEFTVSQKSLKRLIEKTNFAMAQQDVRYYLNGLMIELSQGNLRAVATDGHRLAICSVPAEVDVSETQQIVVPRKGVMELARLLEDSEDTVHVQVGTNHIKVNLPDISFTSKLIDGRFPDYERVVPKGGDKLVSADKETLRKALIRTSILSNEKYRGIRFQIESDRLQIQAHNPEQEEAEEEIPIEYKGESIEIGFNANYIQDALAALEPSQVTITLSDANSSCLITADGDDDCSYVVMPMRL